MSMTDKDYQHFVCIVASDNPDSLINEYSKNKQIEPTIVYKFSDINKLRKAYIKEYENLLQESITNNYDYSDAIKNIIDDLKEISDEEFYEELLNKDENYYLDDDGNILTDKNIHGKFSYCNVGKALSVPFLTKDGREVFQCKKSDIDWDVIHLSGGEVYGKVWDMVMNNVRPSNDEEQVLFDNMHDKTNYFKKFETRENYIISNTAFWGYAFISDDIPWTEINDNDNQFEWMRNFYDKFIKNLNDNILLTIYECKK